MLQALVEMIATGFSIADFTVISWKMAMDQYLYIPFLGG
jgi:hypothetical protein